MLGRTACLLALALVALDCTFDKAALDLGEPDGGAPADASGDGVEPADGAGACVEGHRQCSGDLLRACAEGQYQTVETCALGCKADEARCYTFAAANLSDGSLARGDVDLAITAAGNLTLDVTAGTLEGAALPTGVIAEAQAQATGYPEIFVLRVRNFTVGPNTRLVVRGNRALAVVASGEISVEGIIDLSAAGTKGGPGGYDGGGRGTPGGGAGGGSGGVNGGSIGTDSTGGGGGGNGTAGGAGGKGGVMAAVPGGPGVSDRTLRPLVGGSGGGGGSALGDDAGGGGGAIQLSAGRRVLILGTVVVGGGGGGRGTAPALSDFGGGSGGGAGGAVLLEAPEVSVSGRLALGGGGGGGGGCTPDGITLLDGMPGQAGLQNGAPAPGGGAGCAEEGGGGNGGSLGASAGAGGTGLYNGGGGGGGAGRAHFASKSGHATLASGLAPGESGGLTAESTLARK